MRKTVVHLRVDQSVIDLADRLRPGLLAGIRRTDVLRAALQLGLHTLDAEHARQGSIAPLTTRGDR